MNMRTGVWAGTALSLLLAGGAQAALVSRLGGQAVYDTDFNITWLADAHLAASNTFGVTGIVNGAMTWDKANEWIAAMNTANYLGYSDWRLPTTLQPDPSCGQLGGYSSGYCTGSEMGHLFYGELGGVAGQSIVTTHNANYSLFSNVPNDAFDAYWSGTSHHLNPGYAGDFSFLSGYQWYFDKGGAFRAWAVRPGDSALGAPVVPVPAAAWLLGSALGVLGAVRRKAR